MSFSQGSVVVLEGDCDVLVLQQVLDDPEVQVVDLSGHTVTAKAGEAVQLTRSGVELRNGTIEGGGQSIGCETGEHSTSVRGRCPGCRAAAADGARYRYVWDILCVPHKQVYTPAGCALVLLLPFVPPCMSCLSICRLVLSSLCRPSWHHDDRDRARHEHHRRR